MKSIALVVLLAVTVATGFVVACGGSTPPASAPDPSTSASVEPATSAPAPATSK